MDIEKEYRKLVLTKSSHWKYENEWRIIKNEQDGGPGYYNFNPSCLVGVIFGALMTESDKNIINDYIIRRYWDNELIMM